MNSKRISKASLSGSRHESAAKSAVHPRIHNAPRFGGIALLSGLALSLAACTNGGGGSGGDGGGTATGGTGGSTQTTTTSTPGGKADKVDIVFAIDNSRSMADKQQVLTLALADLLSGLANPPCLDANGQLVPVGGPNEACPAGSSRQFNPITDIHIGVISSSLGGHGSDACGTGAGKQSNNDKGHLLSRKDPSTAEMVDTYQNLGFLAWDPAQQMSPPGESDPVALGTKFGEMILGAGQIGCGYESQLESIYRFLADPAPYDSITIDQQAKIQRNGVDQVLLDQRKAFLRPDSLLMVLSLSDENDCSTREEGQYYFMAQQKTGAGAPFHLPKARAICESDPNNECCYSCGQADPLDANGNPICAPDPSCKSAGGTTVYLDETTDNINLRCFHQKQRFGIDFLYPTDRYINAFTQTTITDVNGNVVPNPIFSDLDPSDSLTATRDPSMVLFSAVVGVPWQDIAKNPADLKQGFKNATELAQANANGQTSWDIILGDPANNVAPLDPFMHESVDVRSGTNPVTGTAITAPGGALNPINGTDWTIPKRDDLQYACVMALPEARDCSTPGVYAGCDCEDKFNDNPLCAVNASTGDPTDQVRAKAYPGLRQLSIVKGLGDQGVVGSICPVQTSDAASPDYAYRPVIASILDAAKDHLQ